MVKKIGKTVGSIILFIIILLVLVTVIGRISNKIRYHVGKDGIEEEVYVEANGQKHYCLIKGENVENPVMIWIHGGPASPDTMMAYYIANELKDRYTLIAYNERGCGRTYYKNKDIDASNETATFDNLQKDLDGIVDYACDRFHQDKVILVGHSFGTMIGSKYAIDHPEKVAAYVGVGQMAAADSSDYIFTDAIEKGKQLGDDVTELEEQYEKYKDNPNLNNLLMMRKLSNQYHPVKNSSNYLLRAYLSPYMNIMDLRWFMNSINPEKLIEKNPILFDFIEEFDVYRFGLEYQVPVGILEGSDDWITPCKTASEYLEHINAPVKEMKIVEGWGHSLPQEKPKLFAQELETLLNKLLDESF